MARLNEPPAPTETVESLKRKFMRQNRDIARANSTQSLRIRNLENETSRLLAENLGLREQILRLQNELENGQAQRVSDHNEAVKSQLEARLLEISALITSLGGEPTRKKSPPKGKITRASPSKSPDQKNWKNMCTLSEAVAGQEGRLPPIMENKSYPRKTFERQELMAIISDAAADTTDSPEIGPPPVSQFVDEEPVKIDLPSRHRKVEREEITDLDPALSINLEQRKKRKDSIGGPESRRGSKVDVAQSSRESTGSLKTGAKRKLSVREDEERDATVKQVEDSPGDFKFTRGVSEERARSKSTTQPEKLASKTMRDLEIARGAPREKVLSNTTSTTRKILGPKSVNGSPKKPSRIQNLDDIKAGKAENAKPISTKERSQERKQDQIPFRASNPVLSLETIEVQNEPETPAGLGIFSPSSSQPSTARAESRDTPPPPELGLGADGLRPNRRARGAVSYAEPNLRDKMRRPTKDLVDAVGADSKIHRNSFIKLEEDGISAAISIKSEPDADDAWKRMPLASSATVENSPLSGKVSVPDSLPSSITTHRKRRESILHHGESDVPRSSSANAITVLLAGNRKAREAKGQGLDNVSVTATDGKDVDIYEFRGSSPLEQSPKSSKEEKPASRSSRRHSSIPRESGFISDNEASDMEVSRKSDSSSSRRRQSSLGIRSSSSSSGSVKEEDAEKALRKSASSTNVVDSAVAGSRSDRIAARRRSMML